MPQLLFNLCDFHLDRHVFRGTEAVVACKLAGADDAGTAVRQTIRFSLREQDGVWRIDYVRTTSSPLVRDREKKRHGSRR